MYTIKKTFFIFSFIVLLITCYAILRKQTMIHALAHIKNSQDAIALFPKSVGQIQTRTTDSLAQAQKDIDAILAIPVKDRTYENTIGAFDDIVGFSNGMINASIAATVDMVYPDDKMREVARATILETQNFIIDHISLNRELYNAVKEYADRNRQQENLSEEQQYFINKILADFEREGLNLPQEKLDQLKKIKKEIAELEQQFDKNIAQDNRKISVSGKDLEGIPQDFIASLEKDEQGNYIINTDFPSYIQVMENCTIASTRHAMWEAYLNKAYPINKKTLEDIVAKRYELARMLGFDTYAQLELDDQMVQKPARAQEFLDQIFQKAQKKAVKEFKELTTKLPESVHLTQDGKLESWDVAFVKNQYKKTAFKLDANQIAEYFPMQETVDHLLHIYEQFFNLKFNQLPAKGLWNDDVRLIEVIDTESGQTLGYLFMDLFPRPNKYNHACEHTMIPATYDKDGTPNLGLVIVVANFPKPTAGKPSLLQLKDVTTFFHEFGHAMHALLGRTKVKSFAGTSVKRDFVELPSQMLEEWLWDPAILTMVSSHYQTGDHLPDALIQTILKSRTYDSGFFVVRQLFLANLSLKLFNNGPTVNIEELFEQLFDEYMLGIRFDKDDHMYASFGHLTGYGARYYGYMWSKVFSHDLAAQIKKEGFLNPSVGQRYKNTVIGKGGSKDPNDLLYDFLGRAPNQDAFLHDMGLE